MQTDFCFDTADGILKHNDTVLGIQEEVGNGKVIWLLPKLDNSPQQPWKSQALHYNAPPDTSTPSVLPLLRKTTGALLNSVVGMPNLKAESKDSELLCGAFETQNGWALHITNITDVLPDDVREVSQHDVLPHFDLKYRMPNPIDVSFAASNQVKSVTLYSPERNDAVKLDFTIQNGRVCFKIPKETFGGYALIEILK